MKKLFIVLTMLFLICPMFAKTVQCVKSYHTFDRRESSELNITSQIQDMIDKGWKVVSITPIADKYSNGYPTIYVIVVFEREE